MRYVLRPVTLIAIASLLALAVLAVILWQRGETGTRAGATGASDDAARLALLDNSLRAVEDGVRESPRDLWDPAYIVEHVGTDPQALSAWVRDNTSWIPYRGILRGATGVLMDRQGNSLDRAILLATLLEQAGHKPRLAHRDLSDADARKGIAAAFDVPEADLSSMEFDERRLESIPAVAKQYGLDARTITQTVDAHNQVAVRIANELDARVADQTGRLLRAVMRPDRRTEWLRRVDEAVSARRDHWWVQLEAGGTWTNLDVEASGDAPPSPSAPDRTLLLSDTGAAALHHEIVVRVIAEQWARGTVAERVAIEHVLRPADLIGKSIVVQFLPVSVLGDSAPTGSAVETLVGEQGTWTASLSVDSEPVASGALERRASSGGGPLGGLGGAIANLAGTDDRELSAVWLEYVIRGPGETDQTIRRTVFDLVGPGARATSSPVRLTLDQPRQVERALALAQRTELLPIACRMPRDFVHHLVAENLIRNRNLLRTAVQNFRSVADDSLTKTLETAVPPVSPLYSLALARLDWAADEAFVYVDRPGLLSRHTRFVRNGDRTVVRAATDIVANPIGVRLSVWDAFALRVAHGVFDTNLEAVLHSGLDPTENTADAFAMPQPWVTVVPAGADPTAELELGEDVRQRIRHELSGGAIVVAPKSPVPVGGRPFSGWWRIDPATGQTLGLGSNGWGTGGVEYGTTQVRNSIAAATLRKAALRAFWVFNTTAGFCLVQETVQNIEKYGFWPGLKAVPVENPNQCAYQGLFWGAVAALPLVVMTVNIRLSAVAPEAASVAGEAGEAGSAQSGAGRGKPNVNPLAETQDAANAPKPDPGADALAKTQPGANPMAATEPGGPSAPAQGKGGGASYPQPFKPGKAPPGEGPYQGDPALRDWLKENSDHPLSQMIGGKAAYGPEGTEGLYRQADAAAQSAYNGSRTAGQSATAARQASYEAYWNYLKQGRGDYMQRLPSGGWKQVRGPGTMKIEAGSAGVAGSGDP